MKILIGCGGVILKDKKILLTKRVETKKNYPKHWTLPAGTLEETDPTLSAAAIREIKEEVNLDFTPTKKLGFYETTTDEYRIIGFVYLGDWKGEVKALETEISEIGRFTYEETKSLAIAFSYRETIEDLNGL
ncbi:MAG: NUDIX hydrolase [Candidatus Peribacteria bacterium]|jgi:ADP-ribose pyrophosphatase YjhB (NUDIX family)|nr:NUDIX hydrolase [Candidatus Peribacteria bacterium]